MKHLIYEGIVEASIDLTVEALQLPRYRGAPAGIAPSPLFLP